ncbi:GNAT family N-acetyltransferase [Ligilactobacillus sp.]|uniref:GNAT family N-acetyltransferase n=1 Tax=Ligilactobacillus sp. TaxID=2767921 RepID=UPI002FDFB797
MIEIRLIGPENREDINIPNEPFSMFGKIIPRYEDGKWTWELRRGEVEEMCFPDENYDYDDMKDSIFLGAYDGQDCVGLAILQPGFFKYMYLYDLKVNHSHRRQGTGRMLIEKAKQVASSMGYCGLYTQGQDNNPGACLFYLNTGFYIGGLDTNVYRHTKQEGKADILFYCECLDSVEGDAY